MAKTKEVADAALESTAQAAENAEAPVDFQDDEYRGHGGSYIADPKTGKRTKVNSTGQEG